MTEKECNMNEDNSNGNDCCPSCGHNVFESSYEGTRVYKCGNPISKCPLNRQWHEDKGGDEYRTPLGKTKAQVRRVNAEFSERQLVQNGD
jgi:hypothetical protein